MAATAAEMHAQMRDRGRPSRARERLAQLCAEMDGALRRFLLRRVRSAADADDLAQEVYLRIARHPCLDEVACLRAFVFQTALNLVRDRSRRCHTRALTTSVPIDAVPLEAADDPSASVMYGQEIEHVLERLERMPENRRSALLRHRLENQSYAQIAAGMNVSVSMVEKHISAALADIRR
jgi:RNA polymerase sigma factor (sigma-70 family)